LVRPAFREGLNGERETVVGSDRGRQFGIRYNVKNALGVKALHREVVKTMGETYALREPGEAYVGNFASKNEALRSYNAISSE
jgi:hypothetical protein